MSDVPRSGDRVSALEDHPILAMTLCVSTAWTADEFEHRATAARLSTIRRWDRADDVGALLDRIEGRLTVARDLLSGTAAPNGPAAAFAGVDDASVRRLVGSVRVAVDAGHIGYFAAIVRPTA